MPIQGSTTASFILGSRTTPQSNTMVLLPFDGNVGDNFTTDLALPRKYITFYGTAALDSDSKFGPTSLRLQGGQDRVEVLLSERSYTTYTIEAWVKWTYFSTYIPIVSLGTDEDNQMDFSTNGTSIRFRIVSGGNIVFDQITSGVAFNFNTWYHCVLICDGTDTRFMVNGVTRAYYFNTTNPFVSNKMTIGHFLDGINPIGGHYGHIDDLRFTKDVKYGDPYDVPLLPLTVVDNPVATIRSFTGSFNSRQTSTISIEGFNFTSDWNVVRFYDATTNALVSTSSTVTFVNSQRITATTDTSIYPFVDGRYVNIQIENSLTYAVVSYNSAFLANNHPIWTTPEGSILSQTMPNRNVAVTVTTTLAFGSDPIRYSLIRGDLPPGVSLNTTTGFISGLGPTVTSITTWVFVLRATANNDVNRFADRTFSITFNP